MEYLDIELEIDYGPGDNHQITVRSPAGEARATTRLPALDSDMRSGPAVTRDVSDADRSAASAGSLQAFGRALFDAVLAGAVRSRFDATQQLAQTTNQGVRIRLRLRTPRSTALPWELLYDAEHAQYLALSRATVLCRYLELGRPIPQLEVASPLRVLAVISTPVGLPGLDAVAERQRIEAATAQLVQRGALEIRWLVGAEGQIERLQERMRDPQPWHVFHFIGHGTVEDGEGQLALTDDSGQPRRIPGKQLGALLGDHAPLRLAVLNCCRSAHSDETDLLASTAAQVAFSGIPAVVAMQQAVSDASSVAFSGQFYGAIAGGLPVDAAVAEGRKAMWLATGDDHADWALPVLHMRSPDGRLFAIHRGEPARAQNADAASDGRPTTEPGTARWRDRFVLRGGVVVAVATALALFTSFAFGIPLDLRGSPAGQAGRLPPGEYACTIDTSPVANCLVEYVDGRTYLRFDGNGNGQGGVVHQIRGPLEATGRCLRAAMSRLFATDDARPTSSSAGTLEICPRGAQWEGAWLDTKQMRIVLTAK